MPQLQGNKKAGWRVDVSSIFSPIPDGAEIGRRTINQRLAYRGVKKVYAIQIIEAKGHIADNGSITLLETICTAAGDTMHLAYLSEHPVKQINSYSKFFLTKDGIDNIDETAESPDSAG